MGGVAAAFARVVYHVRRAGALQQGIELARVTRQPRTRFRGTAHRALAPGLSFVVCSESDNRRKPLQRRNLQQMTQLANQWRKLAISRF